MPIGGRLSTVGQAHAVLYCVITEYLRNKDQIFERLVTLLVGISISLHA